MGRWAPTPKEEVIPELNPDINDFLTLSYDEKLQFVNSISQPMASRKLAKRLYKCLKLACKSKENARQGVKYVQKFLSRDEKGIVVLAGNVTPIDVYSHIPILCEEKKVPYVFVPSKEDVGSCLGLNKAMAVVLLKRADEYGEQFDKCIANIAEMQQVPN
ncbi:hypothetical protein GJ496_005880 [Pomphorhynchus laevis]|nr:hypothetical protein GJ496_005880 [Pomphorhynchus laevis]